MTKRHDKKLGMNRDITRRDFLNGVNIAVAGSVLSNPLAQAMAALDKSAGELSEQMLPGYYPPTRDGMRGSHPGSFEAAHLLRDGAQWGDPSQSEDTGEEYDLVVVGAGISGLAAAYFYQKEMGPDTRILLVDNHDDFGGHAKRNEFDYKGRTLVDLGGTEYIEAPETFPESAKSLLLDLGVDVDQARDVFDHDLYPSLNLRGGVFFDQETFGENKLVAGAEGLDIDEHQYAYITLPAELEKGIGDRDAVDAYLQRTPLSDAAKDTLLELFCGDTDYLAGKSADEKMALLRSVSYQDFLVDYVGAGQEVVDFLWMWRGSYMGNGMDVTPALDAMTYGLPGVSGLQILDEIQATRRWHAPNFKDDFHFPDGNASVARLLVRRLIPGVAPGNSMNDIVSAKFDYSELDRDDSPVRLRLNATAMNVHHVGDPGSATKVEMTYIQDDKAVRVKAKRCILACYHAIIPFVCPEIPEKQKYALANTIRMPLVSINVLVDNWTAFENLGIFAAYCPGSYCCDVRLTYPLQFPDYSSARSPDEPMTVHMYRIPLSGGLPAGEQFRAGRYELLGTSFETFERNIRVQLGDMLGDGGFDPARDIKGITVNRWPHGYALGYDAERDAMSYWSQDWPEEKKLWLQGRKRFGRISIANSDAEARAMTEAAIDQGYRAAKELLDDS